jgi:hypothetical protein
MQFQYFMQQAVSRPAAAFLPRFRLIHFSQVPEPFDSCKKIEFDAQWMKIRASRPGSEA